MTEDLIGTVTHYFGKVGVASIEITHGQLHVGDTIRILGHTSDFTQTIESMQIDHNPVESASTGDLVGVKVAERAREHDKVYRAPPSEQPE